MTVSGKEQVTPFCKQYRHDLPSEIKHFFFLLLHSLHLFLLRCCLVNITKVQFHLIYEVMYSALLIEKSSWGIEEAYGMYANGKDRTPYLGQQSAERARPN